MRSKGDACLSGKNIDVSQCPYRMQGVSGGPGVFAVSEKLSYKIRRDLPVF
jgi:hypothetical protein